MPFVDGEADGLKIIIEKREMPMSIALSAGASLTPSPVIATTSPSFWYNFPIRSLSSGVTRAKIFILGILFSNSSSFIFASSLPVSTSLSSICQFRLLATESAVPGKSPVTKTILTPCARIVSIAAGTSGRMGS